MSDPTTTTQVPAETRCSECGTLLGAGQDRETTAGGVFCRPCYNNLSAQLQQVAEAQGRDINYSMATLGGLLGAALGVAAWWGFTVLTHVSFGLVAVVIGFTVGHGVVRLSGGKRAPGLQGLSVAIAALAFVYASYLVNRTFIQRALAEQGNAVLLPMVPGVNMFLDVLRAGFGIMDVVFFAIVVYEAWKIPRPVPDFRVNDPDYQRRLNNLRAVAEHRSTVPSIPGGDSRAPAPPSPWRRRLATLGPLGVALVFVLSKLKLIVPALKMTKLGTLVTMVISVWVYATLWGLWFALGFVLLIFIHELGHVYVLRREGIPASAPMFIPFVGAVIAMRGMPRNGWIEALVGIGGPVLGGAAAVVCLAVAAATGSLFWYALASTGFLLNLFNLLPIRPLDGGRIVGVISPWLWAAGYVVGIAVFAFTRSPILLLILFFGIFEGIRAVRAARERYYEVDSRRRLAMAAAYFGLMGALTLGMWIADKKLAPLHEAARTQAAPHAVDGAPAGVAGPRS